MKLKRDSLRLFIYIIMGILLISILMSCKNLKLKQDSAPKQADIVFNEAQKSMDIMKQNYDKEKNLKEYLRINKIFEKADKYHKSHKYKKCMNKSYAVTKSVNNLLIDLLIQAGNKYYQAKLAFDKFTEIQGSIYTPEAYDKAKALFDQATKLKDVEHNYKQTIIVCEELKKISEEGAKLAEMKRCADELQKLENKVLELEKVNPNLHLMDEYIEYMKIYQQSTDYFDKGDLKSAYKKIDDIKFLVEKMETRTNKEKAVRNLFELDEKVKNFRMEYGKKLSDDNLSYLNNLYGLAQKYLRTEEYTKAIELAKDTEEELNKLKESLKREEEKEPYKKFK